MPKTLLWTLIIGLVLLTPVLADSRRDGPDGDQRPRPTLSDDEMKLALDVVQRVSPELVDDLRKRYAQDPQSVEQLILKRFPRMKAFLSVRRWDERLFDLKVDELRLSHQTRQVMSDYVAALKSGRGEAADKLQAKLQDVVTEHVTLKQTMRQHEVERLEARLARVREELLEQEQHRDEAIERRLEELQKQAQQEAAAKTDKEAAATQPADAD